MKNLMKTLCLVLILTLAGCGASGAPAESEAVPALSEEAAPAAAAAEAEAPEEEPAGAETAAAAEPEGIYLDFSVTCVDGTEFSLADALTDHELVMINLWATWCPPCRMEFPYLQQAWEQVSDRVALIALSVEPDDTEDMIRDFAEELGLSFPMARSGDTGLDEFVTEGIPTSLLVDRTGRVCSLEVGALTDPESFLAWFDEWSGPDYDPNRCTYTVYAYDYMDGSDLEGVVINFCTDTTCTPVTTSEAGEAVFTGPPARYHVQVVKIPEGWQLAAEEEWTAEPYGQTFYLPFFPEDT